MQNIYLDTCAVIDSREKNTEEARQLLQLIMHSSRSFVTSELTIAEALVHPIRRIMHDPSDHEAQELRLWYAGNLIENGQIFQTVPITPAILEQAAVVRGRVGTIKLPDAIHVATAIAANCGWFLTGDTGLSRSVSQEGQWQVQPRFKFVGMTVRELQELMNEISR